MSDRSATVVTGSSGASLAEFRRNIGRRVLFVPPASGRTERGTVAHVDHRMVYVDYGYPNPVRPELGNAIATHPSNLRLEPPVPQSDTCLHCAAPVFSDAAP
ncbi:hypothetical protein [Nocardia sp. NPDC050710]|uniref:hypothetical protein n=1 Tax=Nocardia sp. NPDC050710 TaxID=3157220 RepID=UPI0033E00A96